MIAILHKSRFILTLLVAVYFIFPLIWTSYLISGWTILSIGLFIIEFNKIRKAQIIDFFILFAPFVLLITAAIFYSGDHSKLIERGLSFVVFPICIFLGRVKLSDGQWKILVRFFWGGLFVLCLRGLLLFIIQPYQHVYTEHHDFIFKYRNEFNTNTGISATYASMYLVFGIVLVTYEWIKSKTFSILGLVVILFMLINLFILSAKMPIISLIVLLIVWIATGYVKLPQINRGPRLILAFVIITGLSTILFFTRWNEVLTFINYSSVSTKENSVGIRKMINQCNMELASAHFLKGVGPLNVQNELNRCYYQFEGDDFSRHTFNSHNQYFDYLLSYGVVGLLILLIMAIYPLWLGFKRKEFLLISFSILTILCMLTENILSRQSGVVFYCFFYAMLVNHMVSNKKTSEGHSEVSIV